MPRFAHTLSVSASPATVFAILEDFTQTASWLARCTGIDRLDAAPNDVGTRLRYHYDDGRHRATMDGEVIAREPDRHFAMKCGDRLMDVTVDFVSASDGVGTTLTHTISIAPKGVGKLLTPMIRRDLPQRTRATVTGLKALAEARR